MNCYFFGTFDPVHKGHIEISKQVKEKIGFDKVIFVPSYMPPHKIAKGITSFEHRLNMLKEAIGADCVIDIERKLSIPSYSYKTIQKLIEIDKTQKINFILGFDQFFTIENWKEPQILKELIRFIVIPRKFENGQVMSEKAFDYFKNKGYDFEIVDIDFLNVSSNKIRLNLKNNEDILELTTKEVKDYIERNGLYNTLARKKTFS